MIDNEICKRLEIELANRFRLDKFRSGRHTIRNEKGWRENEISIEYIWLILFDRAFFGRGGILNVKYEENLFQEFKNNETLAKAVFSIGDKGEIESFYEEEEKGNFTNLIQEFNNVNLFEANKGIALDGIIYQIKLSSMNIETTIEVNNPNHESWQNLEKEFWKIGKEMSEKSRDEKLKKLFE